MFLLTLLFLTPISECVMDNNKINIMFLYTLSPSLSLSLPLLPSHLLTHSLTHSLSPSSFACPLPSSCPVKFQVQVQRLTFMIRFRLLCSCTFISYFPFAFRDNSSDLETKNRHTASINRGNTRNYKTTL